MDADILEVVKKSRVEYEKTAHAYGKYPKRLLLEELGKGRLKILYGLRGTGKTTRIFQEYLDTAPEKRIYFHANELRLLKVGILQAVEGAIYLFGEDASIFFDEINRIEGWEEHIKVAYDKYPSARFFLSGSSSLNLLNSKKLLARRASYIPVKPLSFREYTHLKEGILLEKFEYGADLLRASIRYDIYLREKVGNRLLQLAEEYVRTNLPYLFENERETLRDLVEKAIFLDIAQEARLGSQSIPKMERLVLLLSASNKVTYEGLSRDLGISKSTVSEMLGYLEKSGIIKRAYPYKSGKAPARKEWKYYFTVPAIREYYAGKLLVPDSDIRGNMLEDIFASNFEGIYFSDIDFVYNGMLVEIGSRKKGFGQLGKSGETLRKVVLYMGPAISEYGEAVKIPLHLFLCSV